MKDFKKVISYFLPFIKQHKVSTIMTFIPYGLAMVLVGVVVPVVYKNIINQLSVDIFSAQSLLYLFLLLVGIKIIVFIFRRIGDFYIVRVQTQSMRDIYNFSFKKITDHSYNFFADNFVGSLVAKSKRFTTSFEQIFDIIVFSFYFTSIYMVGMFIVLIQENLYLGIFFLIWSLLFLSAVSWINKKKIPLNLESAKQDSKVSGSLSDVITNIINVKIFSAHTFEIDEFKKDTDDDYNARHAKWTFDNKIWFIQGALLMTFEVLGMGAALFFWTKGMITTGTIVLLQIYMGTLGKFLWELGKSMIRFTNAISDCVEFVEIIEQPVQVQDVAGPETCAMNNGDVNFKNISFTYPDGDHVFEKFNLHIPAGQSVGVVGKSGSGKTTLTKLLLRFYDVDNGSITIDGQNVAAVSQGDLRSSIAYIPQETILFHRSIYENIIYGHDEISKDEVMEIAQSAHVDEFVQNLAEGYGTKVGERGIKLSGGQRQRIGIARAMLKKSAPILMLDEATSSLDSMSEQYIQESFEKLSKNRTTIVIAHRLSTIQNMDRIIVMEKGKIIEDGSHTELLKKNGHYAELWNSQINGFIPDN